MVCIASWFSRMSGQSACAISIVSTSANATRMMFIRKSPNSHGFVNPRHLEEIWRDQFDWVYREYDYAVFPMTITPMSRGGHRCC
jgi:hypothetical protein